MKSTIHENKKNKLQSLSKNLKTFLAITIITILGSCSKDDDAPTPNPADAIFRVKEMKNASGTVISSYQYNAQDKISKIIYSSGSFSNYTYNAQGLLTIDENGGNVDPSNNSITNYTYDASGANLNYVTTRGNGSQQKVEFTNNSSGLPIEYKYYSRSTASSPWVINVGSGALYFYNANNKVIRFQRPSDYYIYAYDDRGNQSEIKSYRLRTGETTFYLYNQQNLSYDNKKAPVLSPYNYAVYINNYLTYSNKVFNQDGTIQNETSGSATYEFNEAGYVTKQFGNSGNLELSYVLEKV